MGLQGSSYLKIGFDFTFDKYIVLVLNYNQKKIQAKSNPLGQTIFSLANSHTVTGFCTKNPVNKP